MFYRKAVVMLVLFITTLAAQAQDYNVEPGLWEMTYRTRVEGVPDEMASTMQKGPKVKRECVTRDNMDFKPQNMGGGCKYTTISQSASRVAWDIRCQAKQQNSTGRGEINFNGTTLNGWFELNMQGGPMGNMQMRNSFTGERVDDC